MASTVGVKPNIDFRTREIIQTTTECTQKHVDQPNGNHHPLIWNEAEFLSEERDKQSQEEHAQIWSEALVEAKKLAMLIAETQKKLCNHDSTFRPIDPENFTLAELLTALQKNRDVYENEDLKGITGFLRKGFRKMGENAESFKMWLEMVPKDTRYTAPIVGGLMVFLTLTDRMHKVREDVFKMMTAVPEDFNDLRDYLAVYHEVDDKKLQVCAANVCTSILRTLYKAVQFMGENPFKKALKALKGERHEKEIIDTIDKLKESKISFRNQIEKSLHTRVDSIFKLAKSSSVLQRMIIYEVLAFRDQAISAINSGNRDLRNEMQDLRNIVMESIYNKLLTDQDERNYLAEMAARKILDMEREEQRKLRDSMNLSELAKILEFDKEESQMDLLYCLRTGKDLVDDYVNRLCWIKKTESLHAWLIEAKSEYLMIEANIDTMPYDYTSALSFLCAEIAHLFEVVQNAIALTHFCGLQAQPGRTNRRADAKGMMINLIGQLLEYSGEALAQAGVNKSICHGIEKAKLPSLCESFETLIFQLPKPFTVVVLIDAIDFYETPQRLHHALKAIKFLLDLVTKTNKQEQLVFKLLVTAPNRSIYVEKEFSKQHRIIVPEDPIENILTAPDLEEMIAKDR